MQQFMGCDSIGPVLVGLGGLLTPILFTSFVIWVISPGTQEDRKTARVARTLPYTFPLLRSTVPFLLDGLNFFLQAS